MFIPRYVWENIFLGLIPYYTWQNVIRFHILRKLNFLNQVPKQVKVKDIGQEISLRKQNKRSNKKHKQKTHEIQKITLTKKNGNVFQK